MDANKITRYFKLEDKPNANINGHLAIKMSRFDKSFREKVAFKLSETKKLKDALSHRLIPSYIEGTCVQCEKDKMVHTRYKNCVECYQAYLKRNASFIKEMLTEEQPRIKDLFKKN